MTTVANLTLKTKTRSWRFALTNALPKGHSFCRRAIRFAEGPTLQTSTSYPLHGGISILINRFHTKSYVNEHGVRFDSVTGNFSRDVYQNYFIISGSTDNVWSVMLYWFIECQPFVRELDTCRPLCAEKESSSSCEWAFAVPYCCLFLEIALALKKELGDISLRFILI